MYVYRSVVNRETSRLIVVSGYRLDYKYIYIFSFFLISAISAMRQLTFMSITGRFITMTDRSRHFFPDKDDYLYPSDLIYIRGLIYKLIEMVKI